MWDNEREALSVDTNAVFSDRFGELIIISYWSFINTQLMGDWGHSCLKASSLHDVDPLHDSLHAIRLWSVDHVTRAMTRELSTVDSVHTLFLSHRTSLLADWCIDSKEKLAASLKNVGMSHFEEKCEAARGYKHIWHWCPKNRWLNKMLCGLDADS